MKVAFLATDGVEQAELTAPWKTVEEQGWEPELVSIKPGTIQAVQHLEPGDTFAVDRTLEDVSADDYDALVVPGGVANPDELRMHEEAVRFVRSFIDDGKPAAAICHGPWLLVEADVVRGREIASWPSLKTDIENAGGTWRDEEVIVDEGIVTSRRPADLPAFCGKLVDEFLEGRHERARAVSATASG